MAVEDGFYFGFVDSLHLINRHCSDLAILGGANQGGLLKLLGVFVASLSRPNLQTDVNDWPPKVELVGGVRMVISFVSLPA
jgi:hypothetical protein